MIQSSFFSDAAPLIHHLQANFPSHAVGLLGGAYDFFNAGHLWSLKSAKDQCDLLGVALLPDAAIQSKDAILRPIQSFQERAEMLLGTQYVDFVIDFSTFLLPRLQTLRPVHLIEMVAPDGTKPIFQEIPAYFSTKKIPVALDEQRATDHAIGKVCHKLNRASAHFLNLHAGYSPFLPKDPKIIFPDQLNAFLQEQKNQHPALITTNGSFDLLHPGHLRYLQQAKAKKGTLLVLVNDDASIEKNKGTPRPFFNQTERMTALAMLDCVDFVIPFQGDTPLECLAAIQPALHIKGGSFEAARIAQEKKLVESHGGHFETLDLMGDFSSTQLLKRFKSSNLPPHSGA